MPNSFSTISWVGREILRVAHANCVMAKGVNRQYSKEFALSGGKIGSFCNIRQPIKVATDNSDNLNAQNYQETTTQVAINQRWKAAFEFSSRDLTLSLDDLGKRVITPVAAAISAKIDAFLCGLFYQVYNTVGTAGTTPGLTTGGAVGNINYSGAPAIYLHAQQMLDLYNTPRDNNRRVILNPAAQAESVSGLSGLTNDQGAIGDQYMNGQLRTALGFEIGMDQNVQRVTCGTRTITGTVNGPGQTGATLNINGIGAAATIEPGAVFSIASVDGVSPEAQQDTGLVQQFTVLPNPATFNPANPVSLTNGQWIADGTGAISGLTISPSIIPIGAGVANGTTTIAPAGGAVITFIGAANASYVVNLAYHQDAITLATVDEFMPLNRHFAMQEEYEGIRMRIWQDADIRTNTSPMRVDVIGGGTVIRPEFCCRILG